MGSDTLRVAVVGGGPAGLTLGRALRRLGLPFRPQPRAAPQSPPHHVASPHRRPHPHPLP